MVSSSSPNESIPLRAGDSYESEVFKCRVAAAHELAERACDELAAHPPDPPFATAQLHINAYAVGVPDLNTSSPSMSLFQQRIQIAVESRDDFVSQGVRSMGAIRLLSFYCFLCPQHCLYTSR